MTPLLRFLTAFCCLLATTPAFADAYALPGTERRDVVSGSGGVYRIMIARPTVAPPPAGFPVVYALDGNAVFGTLADSLRGAELRRTLMGGILGGITPALIVAIGYPGDAPYDLERRTLDYTPDAPPADAERRADGTPYPRPPHGGADRFLAFIEHRLKPMIARDFPVDRTRQALLGHSYGGLFVLHVLFTAPDAFRTYVASSPSLWWNGGYIQREEQDFAARLDALPAAPRLILSVGEYEQSLSPRERRLLPPAEAADRERHLRRRAMVDGAAGLAERLGGLSGLHLSFRIHETETHASVPPIAYARALPVLWDD